MAGTLTSLKFFNTGLITIPEGQFNGCAALETIYLAQNQLIEMPDFSAIGSSLISLDVSGNYITYIPGEHLEGKRLLLLEWEHNTRTLYR